MARIIVDDITGEHYEEDEWYAHSVYELRVIRADGRVLEIETVNPISLGEALAVAEAVDEEEDDTARIASDIVESAEEDEAPEEPAVVRVKPLTDAELRERERMVREMNHGIGDITVNRVEL